MRTMVTLSTAALLLLVLGACGKGNVFDLEVGHCFKDPGLAPEISDVETVECTDEHTFEVYAMVELADGDFPGAAEVQESAIQGCFSRFDDYVGHDYETSELDFSWLAPTTESWDLGAREIICTLYDLEGGTLSESMKDSGI